MYDTLKERFLKYVKIETRSDEESQTENHTQIQMNLKKQLEQIIHGINMEAVQMTIMQFLQ